MLDELWAEYGNKTVYTVDGDWVHEWTVVGVCLCNGNPVLTLERDDDEMSYVDQRLPSKVFLTEAEAEEQTDPKRRVYTCDTWLQHQIKSDIVQVLTRRIKRMTNRTKETMPDGAYKISPELAEDVI